MVSLQSARLNLAALGQKFQEAFATCHHIAVCSIKIPCIPWIRHIPALSCKRQELVDFALRVASGDGVHVTDVRCVHTDEVIVVQIILTSHLDCPMRNYRDTDLPKLTHGAVVRAVTNFFAAGGCGVDVEEVG